MDKRIQWMEDWADSHGGRRKVGLGGEAIHKGQGETRWLWGEGVTHGLELDIRDRLEGGCRGK